MSQNLVIANKDNRVVFVFGGIDLTLATDIKVQFGAELYTLLLDPAIVFVDSATELSLNLSATLEVGKVFATVTYFDGASVNGTDITSRELANSDQIVVAIGTQLIITVYQYLEVYHGNFKSSKQSHQNRVRQIQCQQI